MIYFSLSDLSSVGTGRLLCVALQVQRLTYIGDDAGGVLLQDVTYTQGFPMNFGLNWRPHGWLLVVVVCASIARLDLYAICFM